MGPTSCNFFGAHREMSRWATPRRACCFGLEFGCSVAIKHRNKTRIREPSTARTPCSYAMARTPWFVRHGLSYEDYEYAI